jgi:hypothetical protein
MRATSKQSIASNMVPVADGTPILGKRRRHPSHEMTTTTMAVRTLASAREHDSATDADVGIIAVVVDDGDQYQRRFSTLRKRRRVSRTDRGGCADDDRRNNRVLGSDEPSTHKVAPTVCPCDRLPDELLDRFLNGPYGIDIIDRASAGLVCRRWRRLIESSSNADARRMASMMPSHGIPGNLDKWCLGRYASASSLAQWIRASATLPALDAALNRARLLCARVMPVDVATAVALSHRCDSVALAVAMLGAPVFVHDASAHSAGDAGGSDGSGDAASAAVDGRTPHHARRPYTIMSPCHALAERIASAAGCRGLGAYKVAAALARGGSLPSVLACIEVAVQHDRSETVVALAAVAIARRYAQRSSPEHAVRDIVERVWEATSRWGAARTVHLLGSVFSRWQPSGGDKVEAADAPMARSRHIMGDWAYDLVAMWALAPATGWFRATAVHGHAALFDIARAYGWSCDWHATAVSALYSGRIDVYMALARWHALDNQGEFGPLSCEAAARILLYAVDRGHCTDGDFVRGLTWLAVAAPAQEAPLALIAQTLAPWPASSSCATAALVDTWTQVVVRSGYVRGALAVYINNGRWTDADSLATMSIPSAVAACESRVSPHLGGVLADPHQAATAAVTHRCFALWQSWVARLSEGVAYSRVNCDGGVSAVKALAVLVTLAWRADRLCAAPMPTIIQHILGPEALGSGLEADALMARAWRDAVEPHPLPIALALAVRSLCVDDPREEIRDSAILLSRWLVHADLCADLFGTDGEPTL